VSETTAVGFELSEVSDGNRKMVAEKMLTELYQMPGRVPRYSNSHIVNVPTRAADIVLLNF